MTSEEQRKLDEEEKQRIVDEDKDEKLEEELAKEAENGDLSLASFDPNRILGIEVKNLVVSPMPRKHLSLGDLASLNRIVEKEAKAIRSIIWNEERMALELNESGREIVFQPELKRHVAMFFREHEKYEDVGFGEKGDRIWEGDFAPVKFLRRDFLKFMKTHMVNFPSDVQEAVSKLKFSQIVASEETLLDEDSDNTRTIEDDKKETNVPTHFSALMDLSENFSAEFNFEARVFREREGYGAKPQTMIAVRLLNGRQVLRDMMEGILAQLPPDIPRYYGKLSIEGGR